MANSGSTVIPCLRYRDAHAAIDWLCTAFGFAEIVHHAQLVHGNGMIMLGSTDTASEWGKRIVQPDEIGDRETPSCCVVVADVDAHYQHAKTAGAQIEIHIADQGYGGGGYACRDIEGHLWWFGNYDPWEK